MKIKALLSAAALSLLLLGSCGKNEGKPLGDYKDATETDSLSYLYGMTSTSTYWSLAKKDTTFNDKAACDKYLEGVRKAMELAEGNDTPYMQGLIQGMQMMLQRKQLAEMLGTDLNMAMVQSGLAYGLSSDTLLNSGQAYRELQILAGRLQTRQQKKLETEGVAALAAYAKAQNFQKIDSVLYEKVLAGGGGSRLLTADDEVEVTLDIADSNGKKVEAPRLPATIKVDQFSATPIGKGLLRMKEGETASFATTALALLGSNYGSFGVKGSDVLVVKITAGKIKTSEQAKADNARDPRPAAPTAQR